MRTFLLALFFTVAVARAQDTTGVAFQQATTDAQNAALYAAQQAQQDMMTAAQNAQIATEQANQFTQMAIQQMQLAGVNTNNYALVIPPWNDWKIASWDDFKLSVKPGVVKPGTQVRIRWRSGDYAAVYYTLDGWSPTLASTRYTGPITIDHPVHLQAVGIGWNCLQVCGQWTRSETLDAHYDVANTANLPTSPIETDGLLRAGTPLKLQTASEIRSNSAKAGDKVELLLDQDVMVGDAVAIPKGTPVNAVLTQVTVPAGRHRPGMLVLAVRSLHAVQAPIPLLGTQTMEGRAGQNAEQAIIEPGMAFEAKVATDTKLGIHRNLSNDVP